MKYFTLLVSLLFFAAPTSAEIFKWVDEHGKIHFSDKKPANQQVEKIKVKINTYQSVSFDTSVFDTGKKVVIYTASWCGYCKKAKKYFKKKKISYTEYNIEKSKIGKKQYKKLGGRGVPIILVGKKRMNGFSVPGFERIYN